MPPSRTFYHFGFKKRMDCKLLTHQPKHQDRTGNCLQITICDTKLCRRIFLRDKSIKALNTHKRLSTPRIGNWIRSNVRASNDLGHIRSSATELFLYIDCCMFQCLTSSLLVTELAARRFCRNDVPRIWGRTLGTGPLKTGTPALAMIREFL